MNTAEKIETIVLSFLTNKTTSGCCGNISVAEHTGNLCDYYPPVFSVTTDNGLSFHVYLDERNWNVCRDGLIGCDPNLLEAAHNLTELQKI
jgi:hypothetical protein